MSSTGLIENWKNNPIDVGPIYPFVGWEMLMFVACVAFCVAFIVWKFITESATYSAKANQLRESGELAKALEAQNKDRPG